MLIMRRTPNWLAVLVSLAAVEASRPLTAIGGESPPGVALRQVEFQRDVQPILERHCLKCHSAEESKGGLVLEGRELALRPTDSGVPALVPGKSDESELLRRVTSTDDFEYMPPEGPRLSSSEIDLLNQWIDGGLDWPGDGPVAKQHWAYVPPVRAGLPVVSDEQWPANEIDHFILARLDAEKLAPSPDAEKARLIRRAYLDLIGLPPTVEEVDAFLADDSADAFERVVDRLLASPRYGERWARQWLDMARYADSNGFQRDGFRTMWAYRDWVIDAMNRDMPFDEFTTWQIAGDLLPGATEEQRIATGFHRCTTINLEAGTDTEETRINQVIDRVNTTATVWLGTTLECAQCHNHKYDPFTQIDYYRFLAYFNNTAIELQTRGSAREFAGPDMPLGLSPEEEAKRRKLEAEYERMEQALAAEMAAVDEQAMAEWESRMRSATSAKPSWQVMKVSSFSSLGGADHQVMRDGSVLLTGEAPDKDIYVVEVETELAEIRAFKLEALTHATLPGRGPGRGSAEKPNFVLNELTISAAPLTGDATSAAPVELQSPRASFSQNNFEVARAIDGNPVTAWAINPKFGQPHEATFLVRQPLGDGSGTRLAFRLEQNFGGSRTIGRFRLLASTDEVDLEQADLPPAVAAIFEKPAEKRTKKETRALRDHYLSMHASVQKMRTGMESLKKQMERIEPPTTLVMQELDEPRMTSLFKRGSFLTPGPEVEAGTPDALHAASEALPPTRAGLAQWLASRDNPLVARVTVNRWWQEFFGHGLVTTPEDFGTQGDRPTHPELLDWLAVEFMDANWSMKHIHKLIVMSRTYQQDARVEDDLLGRDPYNRLYARGPRLRLDAETIRDNALAITGLLSVKMGGPPVMPPQPDGVWRVTGAVDNTYRTSTGADRFRRGVYVIWRRSAPYPSFANFDAPDRSRCVIARPRTNTPLQALTLMNDPAYVEMALALAARMAGGAISDGAIADGDASTSASDRERLEYAFRACVARRPSDAELSHLADVLAGERRRLMADSSTARAIVSSYERSAGIDEAEMAAWFFVANILLNLDETITKG